MSASTALLTDRYELTMIDAALKGGHADRACVFEVFARRLSGGRRYGVVAGTGRLLDAIDARNVFVDSLFDAKGANPKPTPAWGFVMFPPLGHDAKHLRLAYDGYQEPYANSPMNWNTKTMRLAPLPGAKRLAIAIVSDPVSLESLIWDHAEAADVGAALVPVGDTLVSTESPGNSATTVRAMANAEHLHLRVEVLLPKKDSQPLVDVYLEPTSGKDIIYRFTVGPKADSKQDAANGFNRDPLDPRYGRFDPDWNGDWTYESEVDQKRQRWIAFLKIPFKTLGVESPTPGSFWRGNIGVTHLAAPERVARTLWSATSSTKVMDDRNDFGELVFGVAKDAAATSGKPTSTNP